jgi:predicted metal-binding protein
MAKVTLKWKLVSKNFDKLKKELGEETVATMRIGDNHCKLCVLASGPMCIKREVCRIPENEVWINKEVTVKKKKGEK